MAKLPKKAPKKMGGKNPSRPASKGPAKLRAPIQEGPPPVSQKMLEQIAAESAGTPPSFRAGGAGRGVPPPFNFQEVPIDAPFAPPAPRGGPSPGVGLAALGMALEPSEIGGEAEDAFVGNVANQSSVLGGPKISPEEVNQMIAESLSGNDYGKESGGMNALYSAIEPGGGMPAAPGVGGGIVPAAMRSPSPKSAGSNEVYNPYLKNVRRDLVDPSYGQIEPGAEDVLQRIMLEEAQKGLR